MATSSMVASVVVHVSTRARAPSLRTETPGPPSYLVQAVMPRLYRRGFPVWGSSPNRFATRRGRRRIRLVVPLRSSVLGWQIEGAHGGGSECAEGFGSPVSAEDFDGGNPDRPRHFQGFGAGHKLAAVGRGEEIDLDLDSDPDPACRKARRDRDTGGLIGKSCDDAAVEMAEKLHEVVPARQREFGTAGFDGDDAEAGS